EDRRAHGPAAQGDGLVHPGRLRRLRRSRRPGQLHRVELGPSEGRGRGAPGLVGGGGGGRSAPGKVLEPAPENVGKFRAWWRYIRFDQGWVWTVGCFLGMGLPALLTVQFIPPGTQIGGMAVAVRQAEGISAAFGGLQSAGGALLWYLTLLTGFWILYSTQLGIMDLLPRTVTDILWTSTPGVRRWAKGDVRKVYYSTLVVFVVWGCIAINLAQPFILILLGAFVAGLMMSIY